MIIKASVVCFKSKMLANSENPLMLRVQSKYTVLTTEDYQLKQVTETKRIAKNGKYTSIPKYLQSLSYSPVNH